MRAALGPLLPRQRGFALFGMLWRFALLVALGMALGYGLKHREQAFKVVSALCGRVQALVPMGVQSAETTLLPQGYDRLKEDSLVSLYGATRIFEEAAAQSEHDVSARAAQADAQVALAHAYRASSELMARYAKTLRGPKRRDADRQAGLERQEAQTHVRAAQQFAKEALRLSPIAFVAQRAMAAALLEGGRTERARPYLAQAAAARPGDSAVRLLQADQLARKDARAAVLALQALLTAEPNHNAARFRLALLQASLGDRAAARQEALALLAASPGHALARRLLLELEPLAGESSQARLTPLPREAEVAPLLPPRATGPGDGATAPAPSPRRVLAQKAQAVLGWGWHAAQRAASAGGVAAKRAQTAARQALEHMLKQPEPAPVAEGDYPTLVAAAQKQQQARNGAAAEALWRQALALRPQSNEALVALGWCRLQAHDAPGALGHFGQAAALAPQSAEAQFGLAEAKRMAHDVPGAKAAYGRYLELEPNGPLAPLCHHMLEELSHEG